MPMVCFLWFIALLLLPMPGLAEEKQVVGTIRNVQNGQPLSGAKIWSNGKQVETDGFGRFEFPTPDGPVIVRAPGFRALQLARDASFDLQLEPFTPKALYLSFWGADSRELRTKIRRQISEHELNALVIDIKSSRGHIAYRSNIPLAHEIGAQRVRPLKDLPEFLKELKTQNVYTIARVVVFKDDLLARNHPEYAAHTPDGTLWQDQEQLSWTDPFSQQVWDYNINVAEEAAQLGFDEVQFDYIRFPSRSDLIFSQATDDASRVRAINGFLDQARQRLAKYPVYLSANIFGYICWKPLDGKIGQRLVDLADRVDYLSPMLYPSGFSLGIPGSPNPVANPYAVISHSLRKASQFTGIPPERFRPWLQAFRDYAFDRRPFLAEEIQAQINASDANGSHGWMLWNATSRFSSATLQQKLSVGKLNLIDVSPRSPETALVTQAGTVAAETSPL